MFKMKKFLSILLAAFLVFSLATVAFGLEAADDETTVEATTAISSVTGDTFMGSLLEAKDTDDIKAAIKDSFAEAKKTSKTFPSMIFLLFRPTSWMTS